MKIFLLVMLTFFFIRRISCTKEDWCEEAFYKRVGELIEKLKKQKVDLISITVEHSGINAWEISRNICFALWVIVNAGYLIIYMMTASYLSSLYILILTVVKIVINLKSMKSFISVGFLSTDISDYKYTKWFNRFAVIVDYIYYPAAIWMLMM